MPRIPHVSRTYRPPARAKTEAARLRAKSAAPAKKRRSKKKDGNPEGGAPGSREDDTTEADGVLLASGVEFGGEGDLVFILRDYGDLLFAL
jgi:hypothetical protein